MSDYPSSFIDELAMLYIKQHDFTSLTPAELVKKYLEVHKEMTKAKPAPKGMIPRR